MNFRLGQSSLSASFAAAGSLVLLLVWVYDTAQIFLLGAELTWVYAHEHGTKRRWTQPVPLKNRPAHRLGQPQPEAG